MCTVGVQAPNSHSLNSPPPKPIQALTHRPFIPSTHKRATVSPQVKTAAQPEGNEEALKTMLAMGLPRQHCVSALKRCGGDATSAIESFFETNQRHVTRKRWTQLASHHRPAFPSNFHSTATWKARTSGFVMGTLASHVNTYAHAQTQLLFRERHGCTGTRRESRKA